MKNVSFIFNGRFASMSPDEPADAWVAIEGERIAATGRGDLTCDLCTGCGDYYDARGGWILPGMIDTHVHFREPGLAHKATIESESRAAVAGGVTSYLEMPNTLPPTTTLKALGEKKEIAARSSMTNYGFFLGASASNLEEILKIDPRKVPGVKLFIGSSTGNMAVDTQSDLEAIFRASTVPIMIHAEDDSEIAKNTLKMREKHGGEVPVWEHPAIRSEEACLKATNRALDLAARTGARLHIAHVSTAAELDAVERIGSDKVTLEVTPLHLTFSDEDYKTLGTRIKVNPAVKTAADREALRRAVLSGRITTIGSDHAPHLLKEKEGSALTAASGAPSVQFALPLLMDMFTPRLVVALYSEGPARLFGIEGRGSLEPGSWADVVVVEPCEKRVITDADVLSPCGWTPFIGLETRHKVNSVWVNGTLSLWDGLPTGLRNAKALKFDRSNN